MLRRLSVHAASLTESPQVYVWENLSAPTFVAGAAPKFRHTSRGQFEYAIAGTLHLDHLASFRTSAINRSVYEMAVSQLSRSRDIAPSDDIEKIPNGIVKLRPPLDLKHSHVDTFFADVHCLDIKWSQEKNIKTFQALELKSENVFLVIEGEKFFPARYIHAEFDLDVGSFRHFDGAVQYYSESEYLQRRESDFNYNAKSQAQIKSRSKKLFKLNGRIETKVWVELCCHFLTGNPLTFEYYNGSYPSHVQEALSRIRSLRSSTDGHSTPTV